MPRYTVKDTSTNKTITFDWNGDKPPTDTDMEEVFTQARTQAAAPEQPAIAPEQPPVPEWGAKHPNLYGAYGAGKELLPFAGGIGGSLLGPLGGIGGFAVGEAAKKTLETAMGERGQDTTLQNISEFFGNIAKAGLMEKGTKTAGAALKPLAEKLYGSGLKLSTTLPSAERAQRIETGLTKGILPKESGLNKINATVDKNMGRVNSIIDDATKKGENVKLEDITKAFDDLKGRYKYSPEAVQKLREITKVEKNLKGMVDAEGKLPLDKAQLLKQEAYKIVNEASWNKALSNSATREEVNGTLGLHVRNLFEERFPELKGLNKNTSEMLGLKDSINKAIGRIDNRDLIGLGLPVTITAGKEITGTGAGGFWAGLTKIILDHPEVKTRLAIGIQRSISKGASGTSLLDVLGKAGLTATSGSMLQEPPQENLSPRLTNSLRSLGGVRP